MDVKLDINDAAKFLFEGKGINAAVVKSALEEVMKETVGPGGIATEHLRKGQSTWPKLADSTQDDKRKISGLIFVGSGRVEAAIESRLFDGKVREYGSSADLIHNSNFGKWRYTAGGMYAQLKVAEKRAGISIGFTGTLRHSAAFNKARRAISKDKGRKATIQETELKLRGTGTRKFAATGSLGRVGNKGRHVLARGASNLAYANIVQSGEHKGIRARDGTVFNPKLVADLKRTGYNKLVKGKGARPKVVRTHALLEGGIVETGKARPLLPYTELDVRRLAAAVTRGVEKVFNALRK